MSEISKIEIADDAGNEIREISVPIPFYIRVKLEEGMTRYRVRLIDNESMIRGQYIGKTLRHYLELHVPLIKLPKPGKLRVVVEESFGESEYSQKHQVSILDLDYILEEVKKDEHEVREEVKDSDLAQDEVEYITQRKKKHQEDDNFTDKAELSF